MGSDAEWEVSVGPDQPASEADLDPHCSKKKVYFPTQQGKGKTNKCFLREKLLQ